MNFHCLISGLIKTNITVQSKLSYKFKNIVERTSVMNLKLKPYKGEQCYHRRFRCVTYHCAERYGSGCMVVNCNEVDKERQAADTEWYKECSHHHLFDP